MANETDQSRPQLNLLPCPFCGKPASLKGGCNGTGKSIYWVECSDISCCDGPVAARGEDAAKLWNQRSDKAGRMFPLTAEEFEAIERRRFGE